MFSFSSYSNAKPDRPTPANSVSNPSTAYVCPIPLILAKSHCGTAGDPSALQHFLTVGVPHPCVDSRHSGPVTQGVYPRYAACRAPMAAGMARTDASGGDVAPTDVAAARWVADRRVRAADQGAGLAGVGVRVAGEVARALAGRVFDRWVRAARRSAVGVAGRARVADAALPLGGGDSACTRGQRGQGKGEGGGLHSY